MVAIVSVLFSFGKTYLSEAADYSANPFLL